MKKGEVTDSVERRVLLSSGIGSLLEMYDFSLYAYFAPVLSELFFPSNNALLSLIATFSVFAVGYLMRPLGAILFGHFGDKAGRKKILVLSVLLMGIPTVLTGCLPTYAQVGPLAPLLLIFIRLVQGLSVGSEFAGATVFMAEHSHHKRRGFMCSWILFGINLGLLLGSGTGALITYSLTDQQLYSWGWRVVFIVGILIIPVAMYLRRKIPESPVFEDLKNSKLLVKTPFMTLIKEHFWDVVQAAGVVWVCAASVGLIYVYMSSYLSTVLHFEIATALLINSLSILFLLMLIPFMGALSDKYGRRPLLLIGTIGLGIFAYPLFALLNHADSIFTALVPLFIFGIFSSAVLGTFSSTIVEIFPARVRYSGVALSYNVMAGTGPLLASGLIWLTHNPKSPSFYLILTAIVSFFFILKMTETHARPLK